MRELKQPCCKGRRGPVPCAHACSSAYGQGLTRAAWLQLHTVRVPPSILQLLYLSRRPTGLILPCFFKDKFPSIFWVGRKEGKKRQEHTMRFSRLPHPPLQSLEMVLPQLGRGSWTLPPSAGGALSSSAPMPRRGMSKILLSVMVLINLGNPSKWTQSGASPCGHSCQPIHSPFLVKPQPLEVTPMHLQ